MQELYRHTFQELRFVVKKHWATHLHYDLRLEWNGILLSWAIRIEPGCGVAEARTAIEMEDHKLANLLFEGLHKTGTIMVWDRGTWEPHVGTDDVLTSLERGHLRFTLRGEKLHVLIKLVRKNIGTKTRHAVWELRREATLSAGNFAQKRVPESWQTSVCTGRSGEKIVQDWRRDKVMQPNLFGWT